MIRLIFAAAIAAAAVTSANAAPVVNVTLSETASTGAKVIQNFDSFAANSMIGTNALALSGSDGRGAKPTGSTGNYGSVLGGGTYTVGFAPTSAFSFLLGTLDGYNHLTLGFTDGTSMTYSGSQITNGLGSEGYVQYSVAGAKINAASFSSDNNSFEIDNLAAGVPEPATWAMMIAGFGLVGAAMRRRSTQVSFA